jgi:hypothetical protein
MNLHTCLSLSVLTLFGPGITPTSVGLQHSASRGAIVPAEEARNLKEHSMADLVSLRAGGVDGPAPIDAAERAALCTAQAANGGLEELRGGGLVGTPLLLVLILVILVVVLI